MKLHLTFVPDDVFKIIQKTNLCIVKEINPYYFVFALFFGFIYLFENNKKKFPKNLKFSHAFLHS